MRENIQLACGECKRRTYTATRNKKKQTERLQAQLEKRAEQLRILEGLATDLQRELAESRAGKGEKAEMAVPKAEE